MGKITFLDCYIRTNRDKLQGTILFAKYLQRSLDGHVCKDRLVSETTVWMLSTIRQYGLEAVYDNVMKRHNAKNLGGNHRERWLFHALGRGIKISIFDFLTKDAYYSEYVHDELGLDFYGRRDKRNVDPSKIENLAEIHPNFAKVAYVKLDGEEMANVLNKIIRSR